MPLLVYKNSPSSRHFAISHVLLLNVSRFNIRLSHAYVFCHLASKPYHSIAGLKYLDIRPLRFTLDSNETVLTSSQVLSSIDSSLPALLVLRCLRSETLNALTSYELLGLVSATAFPSGLMDAANQIEEDFDVAQCDAL